VNNSVHLPKLLGGRLLVAVAPAAVGLVVAGKNSVVEAVGRAATVARPHQDVASASAPVTLPETVRAWVLTDRGIAAAQSFVPHHAAAQHDGVAAEVVVGAPQRAFGANQLLAPTVQHIDAVRVKKPVAHTGHRQRRTVARGGRTVVLHQPLPSTCAKCVSQVDVDVLAGGLHARHVLNDAVIDLDGVVAMGRASQQQEQACRGHCNAKIPHEEPP
jgi:hypothetical protein